MELLIVRHAIAEDRDTFRLKSWDDSQRPLTEKGRKRFKKIAHQLAQLIKTPDVIVTSPFRRAHQTAQILSSEFPKVPILISEALTPGANPNDLVSWCKEHLKKKTNQIIFVGHEPHLSLLVSWLLVGSYQSRVIIKKGGSLSLKIKEGVLGPESGILQWALTPKCLSIK